jgi:FkbH-like protein
MKVSLENFSTALKAGQVPTAWGTLRSLVLQPLASLQWQRLTRLILEHQEKWREVTKDRILRVAVVGTYTTRMITELILPHLLAEGYWAEVQESEYGSFETEPLSPDSALYAFAPHYVLVATGVTNILEWPKPGDSEEEIETLAETVITGLRARWGCIKKYSSAQIIQHNFEPPATHSLGHHEGRYAHSATRFTERLNKKLLEHEGDQIRVLDVSLAAQHLGAKNWLSPRWYHHSKHGFDPAAIGSYSLLLGGLWRALLGRTRKVLVCDLDNTLWGGVIGDDGIAGIELGTVSAKGEAHAAFQRYIITLRQQGTLLAVCSKNELEIAQEPFAKHPECPLKLADFSAWECGWGVKSKGLKNIAERLNLGIDSLVFIDDNPAECAEVIAALPEVTVIHLDGDPADFIRQVDELYLFTPLDLTTDDLGRAQSLLVADELRTAVLHPDTLGAYLASLQMQAAMRDVSIHDLPRVEQLFKKTNQFNWNGQTWDKPKLDAIMQSSSACILAVWLKDRHTSHGLVSCAVLEVHDRILEIKNWVMSCRVFSRTLEDCILRELLQRAGKYGCTAIQAVFLRTPKNGYVSAFLDRVGFEKANGKYSLSVTQTDTRQGPITLADQL